MRNLLTIALLAMCAEAQATPTRPTLANPEVRLRYAGTGRLPTKIAGQRTVNMAAITWRCDGAPGPFKMVFSKLTQRAPGLYSGTAFFPGGNPFGGKSSVPLRVKGDSYRVDTKEFVSRRGKISWVSPETGDSIDCTK